MSRLRAAMLALALGATVVAGGYGVAAARAGASDTSALGPGLVTGASDDDPSGIATYAQAGSRFGFGFLWTVILTC